MRPDVIVVAGAMAQRPGRAGHAWVFLNWMLAFRRLGCRVVFVDRMDPSMGDVTAGVQWVSNVMSAAGLHGCWGVRLGTDEWAGISSAEFLRLARGAVLLNVMGYLEDADLLDTFSRRIFLDIDPGFGQLWQANELARIFDGHDVHATVGLNVGRDHCPVPSLGIHWLTTFPPVDIDSWTSIGPPAGRFTTVGSWRGPFAPVELDGAVHGLRVHQARELAGLPDRSGALLEMALDIDSTDELDRDRLVSGGWRLTDPRNVAGDIDSYRRYIQGSLGEFAIAKQAYVQLRTGWFSDRSACYLASGRPVIVSDTGLADHLPLGEGLLVYSTPEDAAEAIADVMAAPARHGKAARALAEEHFDGGVVARSLLERAA